MKNLSIMVILSLLSVTTSSYTKESPSVIAKQLIFPVTGSKSSIGSVWGDERDGGTRKHEGIDIFSNKGTPVVAISDGYIKAVGTDELGGKVITVQPDDYEWEAYYAHLDQQYVINGQRVKKGQLIGTVGNTGNAKTTPSHLHFGIYTSSGAIDPLPYIKTSPKITSPLPPDNSSTKTTSKTPRPGTTTPKKKNGDEAFGTILKNTAVNIIKGELLRRIKL